jgi:DNA primase
LKELGLDIKYVFVWDKDKSMEFMKSEVQRLHGRMRFAMLDREDLLEEKESPVDKGRYLWRHLYNNELYKIR